jgi:polysaccharide export outer membrane protein
MAGRCTSRLTVCVWAALATCLAGAGCCTTHGVGFLEGVPRELDKVSHPTYVIETPDILLINAVRLIPKPPYRIEPLDSILIRATNVLAEDPILGLYGVSPEGTVNLGESYGSVRVARLTLEQAQKAIKDHLAKVHKDVEVNVALGQPRAQQQIQGEHLVRPDGTVGLGLYGSVYVAGMTLEQAKAAIEAHLSHTLLDPEVSVDVFAYNSKYYYIVTDGAGYGEQVYRFPSTGNETVLDAMSQIYGLPAVASKRRIWVARPAPADGTCYQILPVDWKAVTRGAATNTNYQLLPGDRIFVQAEPIIAVDTYLARFIAPVERMLGITLLGNSVVEAVQPGQQGGFGGGGF